MAAPVHSVDILADPGIGRAGGVAGAGELAGELPRRVKPKKNESDWINRRGTAAVILLTLMRYCNTPGEFSPWLACSACAGDDVN